MTDSIANPIVAGSVYVRPGAGLRITSRNADAGVVLTIAGLVYDPNGETIPFSFSHIPNTDRTVKSDDFPMTEGWLLAIQVFASAGTPRIGRTWARLQLTAGLSGATLSQATLVQGYLTDVDPLTYPGSASRASNDGPGAIRMILGTDPAANVEILEAVPAGARWRLMSFAYTFVASGNAANRIPVLTIDDGANVLWEASSAVTIVAGQTVKVRAGAGVPFFTLGTLAYQLPLPVNFYLMGGARIRTVTAALDPADNYGPPSYVVEEWIEK